MYYLIRYCNWFTTGKLLSPRSITKEPNSIARASIVRCFSIGYFIASPCFSMLGVPADLVGTHMSEMLPPDVAQQRMEYIQLTLQT